MLFKDYYLANNHEFLASLGKAAKRMNFFKPASPFLLVFAQTKEENKKNKNENTTSM